MKRVTATLRHQLPGLIMTFCVLLGQRDLFSLSVFSFFKFLSRISICIVFSRVLRISIKLSLSLTLGVRLCPSAGQRRPDAVAPRICRLRVRGDGRHGPAVLPRHPVLDASPLCYHVSPRTGMDLPRPATAVVLIHA